MIRRCVQVGPGLLLAYLAGLCPLLAQSIHWKAKDVHESMRCFEVRLVEKDWGVSRDALGFDSLGNLEVRGVPGDPQEVMFRRINAPGGQFTPFPKEIMPIRKIRLEPGAVSRPATEEEWRSSLAGLTCAPRDRFVAYEQRKDLREIGPTTGQAVEWRGLRFPPTGAEWRFMKNADFCSDSQRMGPAMLSPEGRFLVVASHTAPAFFLLRGEGGFPVQGRFFLDFYDAQTARKLVTLEGRFRDWIFGSAKDCRWLTERYFIVPQSYHRERLFVCEFPTAGDPQRPKLSERPAK